MLVCHRLLSHHQPYCNVSMTYGELDVDTDELTLAALAAEIDVGVDVDVDVDVDADVATRFGSGLCQYKEQQLCRYSLQMTSYVMLTANQMCLCLCMSLLLS